MSRELMPKSGIMMPHVVVTRDAAVVGVSTVDGQAGAIDLTGKYLQKTDAAATYQTKVEGASKDFVLDSIQPIMSGALFREDPWVVNDTPFRSTGANGVESVDMMKVTPDNSIKIGSYASSVQGVEIHSAGRLQVVDQNDSGVETKYPVYSKRYRPEIEDLPFAAIGSYVKDSKGRTIGVTRTGINSDIKQLTQKVTFTQPVTVPDAVGDSEAVALKQMKDYIGSIKTVNGSWSVINSDVTRPSTGTKVSSGSVVSEYRIGSEVEASTTLQTDAYIDGTYYGIISVYNKTKGVTKQLAFDDSGTLNSDRYAARFGTLMTWNETGARKGTFYMENQEIGSNFSFNSILSASQSSSEGYKTTTHIGMLHTDTASFADSCWHVAGDEDNKYGCRLALRPSRNEIYYNTWQPGSTGIYTLTMNPVSDERLKHNIQDVSPEKAIKAIKGLDFKSFVYNNDEQGRTRRGIIAQQAEKVEPLYVKTRRFHDNDGVEQEQKELDSAPMLLDTMQVVQDLLKRIEVLEAKLADK